MNSISGFLAALLSPLAMSIGFIIWGENWKANSYSLNLYKCTLAGIGFMIISYGLSTFKTNNYNYSTTDNAMIIVSSIIGIIIGDNTWLLALQLIGAKQVIIIDSLKPFCAAIASYFILNEPFTISMTIGLLMSSLGVVLASTEKQKPEDLSSSNIESYNNSDNNSVRDSIEKDNNNELYDSMHKMKSKYLYGYLLAAINVILDSFGFIITKQFGSKMNTWDINFLRFGFAAVFMAFLSTIIHFNVKFRLYYHVNCSIRSNMNKYNIINSNNHKQNDIELETYDNSIDNNLNVNNTHEIINNTNKIELDVRYTENNHQNITNENIYEDWYIFPSYQKMKFYEWFCVSIGVIFVTFLCPAMSNYAIFQLPISLCLTLTSLGPIYSIPLVYIILGETSGFQSIIGSILAVGGIAVMCI